MKIHELEQRLLNSRVPKSAYSLTGGLPNEAYCIEQIGDGQWRTYYSERGGRSSLKEFESEVLACQDFYDRLRHDTDLGPLLHSSKAGKENFYSLNFCVRIFCILALIGFFLAIMDSFLG